MVVPVSESTLNEWGQILCDPSAPLVNRFRALFGLRHASEDLSIKLIADGFSDSSALLKHEVAYCLGQKGSPKAIPYLTNVLEDEGQEVIVRHEAAEALGAIGDVIAIDVLKAYENSSIQEIAETCQLALKRIHWLKSCDTGDSICSNFESVDPAPPLSNNSVCDLKSMLLDESQPLFDRYRAMFTLRNMISEKNQNVEAVNALCQGLFCPSSALFRHEIAFVLGQLSHPESVDSLIKVLRDSSENSMVRHECAEALGSIATPECNKILEEYLKDNEHVVKESCVVALDMVEYTNSDKLQYALIPE